MNSQVRSGPASVAAHCAALVLMAILLVASVHGASVVSVRQNGSGWELVRNGVPYFVKGAGGSQHLDTVAPSGGNSIRTWGVSGSILDQAAQRGLTVTMGIWDPATEATGAVTQYRNHDALLIWALGNEMESRTGNQVALWQQQNTIALSVKALDPNHPVMTVIAEVGGTKVQDIMTHYPALDILGINSYGGAASVANRLRTAGWTKPYMLTEFGPLGHWEVGTTQWGVPIEQSSTSKAGTYLTAYTNSVAGRSTCVGSYAFLWGDKQEKTHTWYGMFLPQDLGGNRLAAVDAMQFAWTGAWPANRCPTIGDSGIYTNPAVNPGDGHNRFAPGAR